jgi:hypothetical protein
MRIAKRPAESTRSYSSTHQPGSARLATAFCVCLLGASAVHAQFSVRVPGFRPSHSGLHFSNWFDHIPLVTFDILGQRVGLGDASNGLCGGMVYTVRDLYEAGMLPPVTVNDSDGYARPSQPLYDYIVRRLFDSFDLPGGFVKYAELMSPALPDHETWFSENGLAPHGRAWVMIVEEWPQIRADLDQGMLSPIALVRVKDANLTKMGENHQVLAYGYDLNGLDLKILVYDPNFPDDDDISITLNIGDPMHTTDVFFHSPHNEAMNCFFRTKYLFASPPTDYPCEPRKPAIVSLDTGFDDDYKRSVIRNGYADDSYEILSPAGSINEASCATVVPDNEFPIGPWIGTSPRSKWIGTRLRSSDGPEGLYTFRITVNVPSSLDASRLQIAGSWSCDDVGQDVRVNGVSTGLGNTAGFVSWTQFPPGAALGLFHAGANTVDFLVENAGPGSNPVGLRVEAALEEVREVSVTFRRGDANSDGKVDISDAVAVLGLLFLGGVTQSCPDAADADDSGRIELTDAVVVLQALFVRGAASIPAPGTSICGSDPTADQLPECKSSGCGG